MIVCDTPSLFVQVTFVPVFTFSDEGLNEKFFIFTLTFDIIGVLRAFDTEEEWGCAVVVSVFVRGMEVFMSWVFDEGGMYAGVFIELLFVRT